MRTASDLCIEQEAALHPSSGSKQTSNAAMQVICHGLSRGLLIRRRDGFEDAGMLARNFGAAVTLWPASEFARQADAGDHLLPERRQRRQEEPITRRSRNGMVKIDVGLQGCWILFQAQKGLPDGGDGGRISPARGVRGNLAFQAAAEFQEAAHVGNAVQRTKAGRGRPRRGPDIAARSFPGDHVAFRPKAGEGLAQHGAGNRKAARQVHLSRKAGVAREALRAQQVLKAIINLLGERPSRGLIHALFLYDAWPNSKL